MKIKIVLSLMLVSGVVKGQYFDINMIYDGTGIYCSREPFKSVLQKDVELLKKNKVKKVKANFEKGSFIIYSLNENAFPYMMDFYTMFGYDNYFRMLYYYNLTGLYDSVINLNSISGSIKKHQNKAEYYYKDNNLRLIAYSGNDTVYLIKNYTFNEVKINDSLFLKNRIIREHTSRDEYMIRTYDSSLFIADFSVRQWAQTDSFYVHKDTIINKQNGARFYKMLLNNGRVSFEEGDRRHISFYTADDIEHYTIRRKYFYRSDGLIDYIHITDGHQIDRKVKFSYTY